MELRSLNKETKRLKQHLTDHGLYETGMGLSEMRDIENALHESIVAKANAMSYNDELDIALQESEMDFTCDNVLSSTAQNVSVDNPSDDSDNEEPIIGMVVKADVHHPHDWCGFDPVSPEHNYRKRRACMELHFNTNVNITEADEPENKRSHIMDVSQNISTDTDSGVNMTSESSMSPRQFDFKCPISHPEVDTSNESNENIIDLENISPHK